MKKPDGGPAFPARRDGVINDERLAEFNALVEYGGDGSVAAYVSGLVAQRDELLEALRQMVALYDGTRDMIGASVTAKLARADAAMAKAEGR